MGFLDENEPIGSDVRGRVDDLARIARTDFVDEIILTAPQQPDIARRVIREARRNQIDVKVVPDLFGFEPDDPLVFRKDSATFRFSLCARNECPSSASSSSARLMR